MRELQITNPLDRAVGEAKKPPMIYNVSINDGNLGDKILIVNEAEKEGLEQAIADKSFVTIQGMTINAAYIRYIEPREEDKKGKVTYEKIEQPDGSIRVIKSIIK